MSNHSTGLKQTLLKASNFGRWGGGGGALLDAHFLSKVKKIVSGPAHGPAQDTAYNPTHDPIPDLTHNPAHDLAHDPAHDPAHGSTHNPAHNPARSILLTFLSTLRVYQVICVKDKQAKNNTCVPYVPHSDH